MPTVMVGLILLALVFTSRRPAENDRVATASNETTAPAPTPTQQPADTGTLVPVDQPAASDTSFTIAPATSSSPQTQPPAYGMPSQQGTTTAAPRPPVAAPTRPATSTRSSDEIHAEPRPTPPAGETPVTPVPQPVPVVRTPPAPAPGTPRPAPAPTSTSAPSSAEPQPQPQPPPADQRAEISEREAIGIARNFVMTHDVYDVDPDCLSIRSTGYVNAGYTLDALDVCAGPGVARRLGRWRVDALTGELFRQDSDGRFKKP